MWAFKGEERPFNEDILYSNNDFNAASQLLYELPNDFNWVQPFEYLLIFSLFNFNFNFNSLRVSYFYFWIHLWSQNKFSKIINYLIISNNKSLFMMISSISRTALRSLSYIIKKNSSLKRKRNCKLPTIFQTK